MFNNSFSEKTNGLTDQAAQTADQAIKSTQRAANGAFDSLADTVHDLRDQAAPLINLATEQASAMAHRGLDSVRGATQQIRDTARQASDGTVNYIRDEPVKAMLIAAATGATLMALVSLMTRSSHHHA
jgi:ElaB/YqjD/DUF883 family membrane-anchored ribosome-binding protein